MIQKNHNVSVWLETAVAGIRFKPDRQAVEEELREHIEDKTLDLMRIFPGMTEEEAREQALDRMGDPEEIGKELAKIHKPWLGYLWRASKWALGLLAAAALVVCAATNDHFQSARHPLWGERATSYGTVRGEKAELVGYTFQIVGAAFLDYPEDGAYQDVYQVTVRVSSLKFWERIDPAALYSGLTATGPDGVGQPMDRATVNMDLEAGASQITVGIEQTRWDLFSREFAIYLEGHDWKENDRVTLDFHFGRGDFALTVDHMEQVVME